MTARQIALARHALGLQPGRLVTSRNHFFAEPDDDDFPAWQGMVAAGMAIARTSNALPSGWIMFHLTRAGAERALLPGDVLDPEDWPK